MAPKLMHRALAIVLAILAGASLLVWLGSIALERHAGLALTVCPGSVPCEASAYRLAATPLSRGFLKHWPHLADKPFEARYDGYWWVEESGSRVVSAFAEGSLAVRLDGESLLTCDAASVQVERHITAGLHRLEVSWSYAPGSDKFRLRQASIGEDLRAFVPASLYATRPAAAELAVRRTLPRVSRALAFAWAAAGTALLLLVGGGLLGKPWGIRAPRSVVSRGLNAAKAWPPWVWNAAACLALVLILAYGTALRLDALLHRFWSVDPPAALAALDPVLDAVRPETIWWTPVAEPYVGGDPIAYLGHARRMQWPYDASVREPGFVLATKLALRLTGGRNVAVSVASLVSSVLLLLATYLLGRDAFSRPVGLAAALALALDGDAIQQSGEGFRDDLFAFWVVVFLWRVLKSYGRASFANAVWLGLAGGLLCLTRLTSFTLLLPAWLTLLVFPRARPLRERVDRVAVAAVLSVSVVAPFVVATAVAFGDPLSAINMHIEFLQTRADQVYRPDTGLLQYLAAILGTPFRLTDMLVGGLTYYPFTNKWHFQEYSPVLGPLLAASALVGLPLLLVHAKGRLLLLGHACAMLPFTFSWETYWGNPWRHTLHAYPIYLLAAFSAWREIGRLALEARHRKDAWSRLGARRLVGISLGLLVTVGGFWLLSQWLYFGRVREAIRMGEQSTHITAGPRDRFFFTSGWGHPAWAGNFYTRRSAAPQATLRLPLVPGRDCWVTLRMDPVNEQVATAETKVELKLGTANLASLLLTRSPGRMGSHSVRVPAAMVANGASELTLRVPEGQGVELWYVAVHPAPGQESEPAPVPEGPAGD